MPLHLLPKKSWHVGNSKNVARVRADEAAAAAAEAAREQRHQDEDAARRLAILRGDKAVPVLSASPSPPWSPSATSHSRTARAADGPDVARRLKRRRNEDDTDFEMRIAVARTQRDSAVDRGAHQAAEALTLTDAQGHISLFGHMVEEERQQQGPCVAAAAEAKSMSAKTSVFKDIVDMGGTWYANAGANVPAATTDTVRQRDCDDAFGRSDVARRARDQMRLEQADPLLVMRAAAKKIKEVKSERAEREEELRRMEKEERRERRRQRRERKDWHRMGDSHTKKERSRAQNNASEGDLLDRRHTSSGRAQKGHLKLDGDADSSPRRQHSEHRARSPPGRRSSHDDSRRYEVAMSIRATSARHQRRGRKSQSPVP